MVILCLLIPVSFIYPVHNGNSEQIIQFFKTSSHFYYLAFIGFYFFLDPPSEKVLKRCIQLFLVISLITNVFAVYQIFARAYDLPLAWIKINNVGFIARNANGSIENMTQLSLKYENFYRATSYFSEPSSLAGLNVIVLLLMIVPFLQKTGMFFKNKAFNITMLTCSIIATFLTFSLSGVLGLSFLACGIIFFYYKDVKKYFLPIALGSIIILFLVDVVVNSYLGVSVGGLFWNRISFLFGVGSLSGGMQGESFFGRLDSQFASLMIWTISPIIGVGFGNTAFYGNLFNNTSHSQYKMLFPDTSFMALLSETGIISAIVFTTMFGVMFYKFAKYINNLNIMELSPDLKRFAGIMFFWMLQFFETNFITGYPLIGDWFWIPFGFLIAVEHRILIANNAPKYEISFIKYPIKDYFIKGLKS